MVNSPVLVLNQNYEPLNVARARRAVILVLRGKAELLENGVGVIHTPNELIPLPSVIRLVYLVKRPRRERKLTRHEVFHRDDYTCQYCSRQSKQLTLDHVVPRYKGGQHVWENVASACMNCNNRKAGRTPEEAGMRLVRRPYAPHVSGYTVPFQYVQRYKDWQKYLPLAQRGIRN